MNGNEATVIELRYYYKLDFINSITKPRPKPSVEIDKPFIAKLDNSEWVEGSFLTLKD